MTAIRTMSIDNYPRSLDADVLQLLRGGFPDEPVDLLAVELTRARDQVKGFGFLALHDDEIIGVLTGQHRAPSPAFLVYLTVADGHRRQGVARKLLEPFAGQHVKLRVARSNLAAQALYRSGGLNQTGHHTKQHEDWSGDWGSTPSGCP
jgi:ribosomal protein S18 acetylase RimI-like enzyme